MGEDDEADDVKFANSLIFPTIIDGWDELLKKNDIPPNSEVILSYYGYSIFAIDAFTVLDDVKTFPKYHSRCLDPNSTFYFDVAVLNFNLNHSTMVCKFITLKLYMHCLFLTNILTICIFL